MKIFFVIYLNLGLKTPGILLNFIGYLLLAYHRRQDAKFCDRDPANIASSPPPQKFAGGGLEIFLENFQKGGGG